MKKSFLFTILISLLIISCNNDDDLNEAVVPDLNNAVTAYAAGLVPDDRILVTPIRSDITYLINRQGRAVHKWYHSDNPTLMAYLRDDGSVVRAITNSSSNGITIGGKTGKLEIIDKDNNVVWEWILDSTTQTLHHDIALLPNGNILASVWQVYDRNAAIAAGRNPQLLFDNRVIVDKVIEIEPLIGTTQANIVWEWNMWDHLIQDVDSSQDNFGNVVQEPGRIDINITAGAENFSHINGLDYIESLDQIVINSRNLNEFYIIDHSTTTVEAAGDSGGIYGKGGDFLYRWGNPVNYNNGNDNDRQLTGQHDATYIGENTRSMGTFLVFDNLDNIDFSTVKEIDIPVNTVGTYPSLGINGNNPAAPIWEYSDVVILSKRTSGAQRLPSGNTIIYSNSGQIMREVNERKEIIWEYNFNMEMTGELQMGTSSFKSRSYPSDYRGVQAVE